MGSNVSSIKKVNYADMQYAANGRPDTIIINTLPEQEQQLLISGTLPSYKETETINNLLGSKNKSINIFIYGRNTGDTAIWSKYKQLVSLGFNNTYVYIGGLFEWLLLQDIYGEQNFPTTMREINLLKYTPASTFRPFHRLFADKNATAAITN